MDRIDKNKVKEFYENLEDVWPQKDKWHDINQKEIKKYLHKFSLDGCKILNAGSGGNDYDIKNDMYHIDIAENKINQTFHHVVGNIEEMPFNNESFDIVICVGSVLNYCDSLKAINELSRVLRKNGTLILEFENSYSFEYRDTSSYKSNLGIITTSYFDTPHKMWVYSLNYILDLLSENNINANDIYPFHILSSLSYYHNQNENKAAKYAMFDKILRYIPILRYHSGNIILSGTKK